MQLQVAVPMVQQELPGDLLTFIYSGYEYFT